MINTGSKLVLVIAAAGRRLGRRSGICRKTWRLRYKPEQVDAVLITHLHGDHVGGLLNAASKPAFPNAVVHIAKAENDYWLSDVEPNVPDAYKEHLKHARQMARKISEPYLALIDGRPSRMATCRSRA